MTPRNQPAQGHRPCPAARRPRAVMARVAALALIAAPAVLTGCLERTIAITSEPPGAVVWLNDVELGRTPVETDFTFYGTYDVRLRLDGYEPVVTSREAKAPIYEYPVIDLVASAIPADIETRIEWHFDLEPVAEQRLGPAESERQVLERAGELRRELEQDTTTPGAGAR